MILNRALKYLPVILLFAFGSATGRGQTGNLARQGYFDFSKATQSSKELAELSGEWEFYWNLFMTPDDFGDDLSPKPNGFIRIPGVWNGIKINRKELSGKGFATLRLTVDNFFANQIANLAIPQVFSAYRMFINGHLTFECGKVGRTQEESSPKICPNSISFFSETSRVEIILQISNFRRSIGGVPHKVVLGKQPIINSVSEKRLAFDLIVIGALLVTGFYYIGVYLVRHEESFALFFGLFCLVMSYRTSYLNTNFFVKSFPDFNWLFLIKLDFFSLSIAPILFASYLYYFYPLEFSIKVQISILLVGALLATFSLVTPSYLLTSTLSIYQLLILFTCIYSFYIIFLATLRKRNGSLELFIGCIILVLTVMNDMLHAQGIISTAYIAGVGLLLFLVAQSFVFTKRFATALKISHELSAELEIKVKDQTSEIRDLLDNTGQGILSFDETLAIQQHASRAAFLIFQKEIFGANVLQLMFPDRYESIAGYMDVIFKSGGAMRLVKDMLPTEFKKGKDIYDLEYRWIPAGKIKPAQVMLILTNVTTKRKLQKMLEKDERRNQKIIRIAADRHGFLRFYNGVQNRLNSIDNLLKGSSEKSIIVEVSVHFHTIKGGLSGYSFYDLAEIAHKAEDLLEEVIKKGFSLDAESISKLLDLSEELRSKFQDEVYDMGDLVPTQFLKVNSKGFYTISEEKIEQLEKMLTDKNAVDPELKSMLIDIKKQPLRNTLNKLSSDAKYLAFQHEKQVDVQCSGEGTQIVHATLEVFLSNLTHLVRNAVHHGIETPIERNKIGKPETGKITIDISLKNNIFKLVFADDGNGIDTARLSEKAIEKGLLDAARINSLSENDLLRLVFLPNFSTKDEISTFSGRGIGMHAVESSVNRLGGTIDIESHIGKGTTFTITIPVSF